MNSISTVALNRLKQDIQTAGPGSYNTEHGKKTFNAPLAAPFGSLVDRQDIGSTIANVKENPGPGQYNMPSTKVARNDPQPTFKSTSKRVGPLTSDPSFPSPGSYNATGGIGSHPLQGGSPNNILVLQRAEHKKVVDQLFPFIVPARMPEVKQPLDASIGPGSYHETTKPSPKAASSPSKLLIDSSTNQLLTLNPSKQHGFGSSDDRFGSVDREIGSKSNIPGPGTYINRGFENAPSFSIRF